MRPLAELNSVARTGLRRKAARHLAQLVFSESDVLCDVRPRLTGRRRVLAGAPAAAWRYRWALRTGHWSGHVPVWFICLCLQVSMACSTYHRQCMQLHCQQYRKLAIYLGLGDEVDRCPRRLGQGQKLAVTGVAERELHRSLKPMAHLPQQRHRRSRRAPGCCRRPQLSAAQLARRPPAQGDGSA